MMTFRSNTLRPRPFAPHAIEVFHVASERKHRALLWVIAVLVAVDAALVVGFLHTFGEIAP